MPRRAPGTYDRHIFLLIAAVGGVVALGVAIALGWSILTAPRMTITGTKTSSGEEIKVSVDEIGALTRAVLTTDRKTGQVYGLRMVEP